MPPHQSPFVREATIPLDPITLDWKHRKQLIQSSNNTASSGSQARVRAPRVRHAADPILKPTPEPPAEEDQDPEPSLATYSLKKYLQESWFPVFQLGPRAKQDFIWPHYPELHAPLGTRKLRAISRIMPYRIHGAACDYFERQGDRQIKPLTGGSADFVLPSVNLLRYDDKDIRFFMQDVNFVTDITKLLLASVFRTVARCLYMLLDVDEGEDGDGFRNLVQFRTSFEMCPVQDKIFDVVSLPTSHADRTSMIILVIPPWALDNMDFISFINTGPVAPGGLDAFPADRHASASTTIWTMLWDMCSKQKCNYFAVTTYELWAFGNFSSDMERGYISDLFRAPVYSHNAEVQRDMLPSPTMTETLLFWMAACIGIGNINWTPV
ncbi:hypothetical protein M405DRAFT_812528 [Rhizopogon salebrosus TDB-379]|nr:hypothetical protein M405DRAFT_812528 [Rhizopogon salebrosus TDB-379]